MPQVLIELYFKGEDLDLLEGSNNTEKVHAPGISLKIAFDEKYKEEYEELVKSGEVKTLPIEYYDIFGQHLLVIIILLQEKFLLNQQ